MKYLVQVSYTNPSHEHVSLRRRVDTVNRIVEAADEQQAILRVSRQQQALGFLVREAKIIVPPTTINEDVEEIKQIDEAFDKSSPAHAKAQELVSNYGNRSAARAVYHGDGTATIHTTGDKKVSSATRVDHIHDQAGLGYNKSAAEYKNSSKSKGGLKFKTKETEGKSIYGSHEIHISHKGMKEEVEQVSEAEREAGYKMSPAVKAAQAKSDALSKPVKRPQAGTLAAVRKSMEREMERSMKKEEVESIDEVVDEKGSTKGKKAASKMTQKAAEMRKDKIKGSMNKVNMKPEVDLTVKGV